MMNSAFRDENVPSGSAGAPAVEKAIRVLNAVAQSAGIGISEIARATGVSKSTVHGIVVSLLAEGFLQSTGDRKGYSLGDRLLQLGAQARDQRALDVSRTVLRSIADDTGETILFGQLNSDRVQILAAERGAQLVHLSAPIGSSLPLFAGALGKAYLSAFPESEAARMLSQQTLPRHTEYSVTDRRIYLKEVARASAAGYAIERGEYLPGVWAVAVALLWMGTAFLLWAVGIDAGHSEADLHSLGARLTAEANQIRERLDGDFRIGPERSLS